MIVFKNKGIMIPEGLSIFGVSAKESDNPIGKFGTGLKYAIAVLLREKQEVSLYIGKAENIFTTRPQVIRGQEFQCIYMNDVRLPFTTDLGSDWDLWTAYRELASNCRDESGDTYFVPEGAHRSTELDGHESPDYDDAFPESGYTTFVVKGKAFDEVGKDSASIFLDTQPVYSLKDVELHEGSGDTGAWIYYKGIRVYKLEKRALYNYNILSKVMLTENRTLAYWYEVHRAIADAIAACDNTALIRRILEADSRYFESTIDYSWSYNKPGETFNRVMSDAGYSGSYINTSAVGYYKNHSSERKAPPALQLETLPIEERKKLWNAVGFWAALGVEIARSGIRVTDKHKVGATYFDGILYIALPELSKNTSDIAAVIYQAIAAEQHIKSGKDDDLPLEMLLCSKLVEYGKEILLQKRKLEAALAGGGAP